MEHPNHYKYLRPPTPEELDKVIKALGLSGRQFERYFGLYRKCVCHTMTGWRPMPAKYWHLVFENMPDENGKLPENLVRDTFTPHPRKKEVYVAPPPAPEYKPKRTKIKKDHRLIELINLTKS